MTDEKARNMIGLTHPDTIMSSVRVAVVDDDVETNLILRDFLEGNDLSVECFADAETLMESNPCRFDVILLDINLPGIWGSECSFRLRNIGYAGTIFAISGNIELWDPDDLKELGFSGSLGKPMDPRHLIDLLNQHPARCRIGPIG